jgi:leucyl aminopeptidase
VATLALLDAAPPAHASDALIIGTAAGPDGVLLAPGAESVDKALGGQLVTALTALGATGKEGEVVKIATLGQLAAPVLVAVGLGTAGLGTAGFDSAGSVGFDSAGSGSARGGAAGVGGAYTPEAVRRAAGAATQELSGRAAVLSLLPLVNGANPDPALLVAAGEGALLGAYRFTRYKSDIGPGAPTTIALAVPDVKDKASRAALKRATAVATAVTVARDLVNLAPNELYPAEFAARAAELAEKAGVEFEVLDERALKRGGYGGILGVGMGSARPPRLVRLSYRGPRASTAVALVGKGITFDSGGLDIKSAAGMDAMKSDMAGAAAVIATVALAAALKVPIEVVATVPMAENMPGGSAYRPQDVLTMYGGRRVEVLNTDAEGRLIMADAIVRACEDSPAYLLDVATLTGAQLIALGDRTAGVMGHEALRARVVAAAGLAGEGAWPMPMPAELRPDLDSPVADLANITGHRNGGMLAAAHFLSEFVPEGVQWAHIDVAGPAYNTGDPWGYTPKGGTGAPVRTLLAVLEDIAANG